MHTNRPSPGNRGTTSTENRQPKAEHRPTPATGRRQPTDRQRAAARLSIAKARHVWYAMLRRPDFVLPLAVLKLIRQGLLKAVLWHLTDCSARYATRFREGLFATSVVRSLAAAGEKIEDYLEHAGQIVKAFTGLGIGDWGLGAGAWVSEVRGSGLGDSGLEVRDSVPGSSPEPSASNPESRLCPSLTPPNPNPQTPVPNPQPVLLTLSTALAQITWRRLRASSSLAKTCTGCCSTRPDASGISSSA